MDHRLPARRNLRPASSLNTCRCRQRLAYDASPKSDVQPKCLTNYLSSTYRPLRLPTEEFRRISSQPMKDGRYIKRKCDRGHNSFSAFTEGGTRFLGSSPTAILGRRPSDKLFVGPGRSEAATSRIPLTGRVMSPQSDVAMYKHDPASPRQPTRLLTVNAKRRRR